MYFEVGMVSYIVGGVEKKTKRLINKENSKYESNLEKNKNKITRKHMNACF